MNSFSQIQWWQVLAGLGLFLYGMNRMEESLRHLAGKSLKQYLRRHTGNPLKAILAGTTVTALLQSSSLVTLLVMSLAGSGIIGLNNGIGMIFGANLGTTITGWIVSLVGFKFDIGVAILPFIAISGLGHAFLKNENALNAARLLFGFSLMFLGLSYMKDSFTSISAQLDLAFLVDKPIILFVVFGFVLSALIQSSSASMTIYLSSLAAGIITLPQAAYLMIGSDLGTTITALIGTINGNAIRKKVGFSHFYFNFITAILAISTFNVLFYFIEDVLSINNPLTELVLFHSLFNVLGIAAVTPFIGPFTRFLEKNIRSDEKQLSTYLSPTTPVENVSGMEALEKESKEFLKRVLIFLHDTISSAGDSTLTKDYFSIKKYENEISSFYIRLQKVAISEQEIIRMSELMSAVRSATHAAKDMKDIRHNILQLEGDISIEGQKLLTLIQTNQHKLYDQAKMILDNATDTTAEDLVQLKELINIYYKNESVDVYTWLAQGKAEIDTSTGLNILSEIKGSNKSLVNSLQHLLIK